MGEGSPSDLFALLRELKTTLMLIDEIEEEARHEVDDDGEQEPYHSDRPKLRKKFTHKHVSLSIEVTIFPLLS